MFKRRKPNDPPAAPATAPNQGGFAGGGPRIDLSGQPPRPDDQGLGVPPFRPAPPKEASTMGRAPFPGTPAPPPQAPIPAPSAAQPRPAQPVPKRKPDYRRTLVVGRGISVQGTV